MSFSPTLWMFHALSSHRLCLLLNYPGKAARSESKAEIQTFAAPLLFYYAIFSLLPVRRLLFSVCKGAQQRQKELSVQEPNLMQEPNLLQGVITIHSLLLH